MACSTDSVGPAYAELHCISNFSFLHGASHPEELVERAHTLGYRALALTDECSLSGVVRAHEKALELGLALIIGSEVRLEDGPRLVLLAPRHSAYSRLCNLITRARRRAPKGEYRLLRDDLRDGLDTCLGLLIPPAHTELADSDLRWFAELFPGRGWLAVTLRRDGLDPQRLRCLRRQGARFSLPLCAAGEVRMHSRARRPLQDLLSAVRHNRPVAELGLALQANGEQHLRSRRDLGRLYPADLLAETLCIAERCRFNLQEIRYRYPDDVTPQTDTPRTFLRRLTEEGSRRRWPEGCPARVRRQIEHELGLIAELGYEPYFLTVWDIVRFARERGILCQGRGSAANSAVCYCLGITEVDPARMNLLFERFISRERGEPPDIDVDFEHERREEVIQYIYRRYGRERAALAASITRYRPKSALRDAAKALGLEAGQIERLTAALSGRHADAAIEAACLREAGFDPENPLIHQLLYLANELLGFPRHLSQHVGGFVITRGRLCDLVPVENATMPRRSVIQWDKNDLDTLGLLKVDILALGMLSAIRKALALIDGYPPDATARPAMRLQDIPPEQPAVYAMLQRADAIGVFQIESRAQMSMLPRLRPASFYDLVIEVAIVRPGPIQGDMVHPYLRRRQGLEPVTFPSEQVREVLERTLGVPLFQEQVIKLAMVAADFTPGEADQLRRAMAAWRRRGGLEPYRQKLMRGMAAHGYEATFAERIYRQILGFGEYGFPESHAASFALLVYVSAWIKCHHPAAFCAALINSQPMGFYAPAQLVRDAREHGVQVRPATVIHSAWDCTLEAPDSGHAPALRLGLRLVKGLSRAGAARLTAARAERPFQNLQDLSRRAALHRGDLKALAAADALRGLSGHRHSASWEVAGIEMPDAGPLLADIGIQEQLPCLHPPDKAREVLADYTHLGLSLRAHPLSLLRRELGARGFLNATQVAARADKQWVRVAGLVLVRQRPGNGKATFLTLEDETGSLNLIVWGDLAARRRNVLLGAKLLGARARIQRADGVQHLICGELEDQSPLLGQLAVKSRDFH